MATDDLQRFVAAQQGLYAQALAELRAGAKTSHWMWFVFPQLRGLGHSATAQYYGLQGAAEALAYWRHPLLGPRLLECAAALLGVSGRSAREILGTPDDLKLRSCMTLFAHVAPEEPVFRRVLERYCDGAEDPRTLALLQR